MLLSLILVLLFAAIVYLVNVRQAQPNSPVAVQWMLYLLAVLPFLFALYLLLILLADVTMPPTSAPDTPPLPELNRGAALVVSLLSVLSGVLGVALVRSRRVRLFLARSVFRSAGKLRRYNPDSLVHTTALLFAFLMILSTLGNFVLAGGIEGLASDYAGRRVSPLDLLFNVFLYGLMSLVGVGFLVRRTLRQTLQRLGLDRLSMSHIGAGVLVGIGLFVLQMVVSAAWMLLTSPEAFSEQTAAASELFNQFSGSLLLGLLLALSTGIGEELLFRGALQPVFGNLWTTIFFVLLHTQYTLTPAALVIFLVSYSLGMLARRTSTVAAMTAHVIYNFIPFLLFEVLSLVGVGV